MENKYDNIVMLPTNEKAQIGDLFICNGILFKPVTSLEFVDKMRTDSKYWIPQHIHILSNEEIKEGDWVIKNGHTTIYQIEKNSKIDNCKKIIATTDKSLKIEGKCWCMKPERGGCLECNKNLPQPSPQFIQKYIEEYNNGNVITEVMVEYEIKHSECVRLNCDCGGYNYNELKINPKDNTITISKCKDSWSREEIKNLKNKLISLPKEEQIKILNTVESFDKWIEENL